MLPWHSSVRRLGEARGACSADVVKVTFPERTKSVLFPSYNEFKETQTMKDSRKSEASSRNTSTQPLGPGWGLRGLHDKLYKVPAHLILRVTPSRSIHSAQLVSFEHALWCRPAAEGWLCWLRRQRWRNADLFEQLLEATVLK